MGNEPKYDWPTIRREYSTAQFSDSELARRHGCSRASIIKRKKKENWKKDNSTEVRHVAQALMVADDASIARGVTPGVTDSHTAKKDQTEIELAAQTRVNVLRDHRNDIKEMRALEAQLMGELKDNPKKLYMCNYKGKILQKIVGISVTEKAQALNMLSSVQTKRITIERIAFNLNDGADKDDLLPTVIVHDPSAEGEND